MTQRIEIGPVSDIEPGPVVDAALSARFLRLTAEVADRLLRAEDAALMVDELFALIRAELRLDVFFNYRVEGDRLLLEASGGLTPEEAAAGAELTLGQAVCGCVARDRRPAIAEGVQASDDPMQDFIRKLGIDAYACTPLLHGQELLGTLGFGRRWTSRFAPEELSFLHTICHYVTLAKYRLRTEAALRDGLESRQALLAELNHRVRNALQVAVGLVRFEAGDAADTSASAALARAADRLELLALAHRPLYASEHGVDVDVARLLGLVLEREAYPIRFDAAASAQLPVDKAASLALLVHALLLHADSVPQAMRLDRSDGGNQALTLAFDGPRWGQLLPAVGDLRLIKGLARQLRATLDQDGRTGFFVMIPVPAHG